MINIDKLLELQLALSDSRFSQKSLLADWRDETLLHRPAKKKKRKKPQKVQVEIEDVSNGKL